MLWFTGSQTVGCDCATELNWIHRSMHTIFTEAVHTCTHLYTHHLQWSNAHTQKKCHKKYLYQIEMKFVYCYDFSKKKKKCLSGLPWWLRGRVHLPVQETQVQFLVLEECSCQGATKPVHHSCGACALEPGSHKLLTPRTASTEAREP